MSASLFFDYAAGCGRVVYNFFRYLIYRFRRGCGRRTFLRCALDDDYEFAARFLVRETGEQLGGRSTADFFVRLGQLPADGEAPAGSGCV